MTFVKHFMKEEAGQDLIEYSLLLGFLALAAAGFFTGIKGSVESIWGTTETKMAEAAGNAG